MPVWLFFRLIKLTNEVLSRLDYAHLGSPFVWVPAKTSTQLEPLDYAHLGSPFVGFAQE